jgi:hypothetical protein
MRKISLLIFPLFLAACASPDQSSDSRGFALEAIQVLQQYNQNKANIAQQRTIQSQQPVYTPSQPTYIQQGKCYQDAFANVRCY